MPEDDPQLPPQETERPEADGPEIYQPPKSEPLAVERPRAWPLGLLFGFLNFLVGGALGALFAELSNPVGCVIPVLLFAAEVVAGVYLRRNGQDRLGKALIFAPVFTAAITVVAAVCFFGICLVIASKDGF